MGPLAAEMGNRALVVVSRTAARATPLLDTALQVPSLASYNVTPTHFPVLIEKAFASSSMQGNPIKLTPDEMREILTRAL